ncbi:putative transcriptional regulator [Flavobacterium sp. PL11]|uniref:BREX system P-loop protein BrxC n=1 Tax=Flavobacterium sp. PL11 TaxID=3071717 RepID=UPI002E04BB2A|nr:putative transcriptional regulator [Flavobacterium sp. PL11]
MIIKDLFLKDINRPIETVIKADDREHISDEVAEYVVTKEISKKIRDFFHAYNNNGIANGVWISGFFGSGKSHLLKILSYVIENKEFDGYKSGELFAEKIEDDEMLKGDVMSTTRIPSESILFNIDQQAQITSKADENAILSVFYKVFFDHLGYYGFQPHVAEFEMWLDKQDKYEEFKTKIKSKNRLSWEEARSDYFDPMVTDDVASVLGEMNNTDASKYDTILDDIEDRQKQSIEDFCEKVQEYIKMKPAGFRLNFFVDEVGQYISDNTKLMLNLQTVAETLATRTKGHSWILVTSQEDMEKVVGDMNKSQQNDFSRIQARFSIKIPLTSANVDEVIEKRLLKKDDNAQKELVATYKKDKAHLETLLSFSDAGVQFKGYKSETDFANKYPFAPYQFDLFQQCRRALSTHNAFQGKHASVGERSMLGVFQQVIQNIEQKSDSAIVSFDMMFDGIRNELRGEIQSSIILAERNLDNDFAKKVLKTLFLVKYYGNFKTTKRNISVLMIEDVNVDLKVHDQNIDEALNLLELQSYVQRNGEVYEFLTDDEKDVEQEIKATDIDDQIITQLLKDLLFDEIIRDNKIKNLDNKQDYDFVSKIDGITLGKEKELEIEIITENYPDHGNELFIQSQTMGSSSMKLVLPSDALFMRDLRMYLRTDRYVKQNQSTSNRVEVKRILQEKSQLNVERRRNLILLANKGLSSATIFLNGAKQEMSQTTDGKTHVINGFQNLIKSVYSSLRMIGAMQYSEDTVKITVKTPQDDLFGTDDETISEAESEVLNLINRRKKQSDRTSLNDVKTHFSKRPYGWYPNAIWTIVAKLYKRGKIEFKDGSNTLENDSVINALLNSSNHGNTLLEPQTVIDPKLVKDLKQAYAEAFDESCSYNDAKEVATAFKQKIKQLHDEVKQLLVRKSQFPFLKNIEEFSTTLERLSTKEYAYFLTNLKDFEDTLLDTKEDVIDPIKRFMNGDQVKIYEGIRSFVNGDVSNIDYIEGEEFAILKALLANPKPYQGSQIKDAKAAQDELTQKVLARIEEEKKKAITAIEHAIADIKSKEEYNALESSHQNKIVLPFQEEITKLQTQRYIAVIRDVKSKTLDSLLPKQLNEMMRLAAPVIVVEGGDGGEVVNEPTPHYIRRTSIKVPFSKTELRTEEDVNDYVEVLKKALLEQINESRRISL